MTDKPKQVAIPDYIREPVACAQCGEFMDRSEALQRTCCNKLICGHCVRSRMACDFCLDCCEHHYD